MKNKYFVILWFFIIIYFVYFSLFSIFRYRHLYAEYFDLGIMQQTVFNTYQSLMTGNTDRFLELTSPIGSEQIKRMAIHNDVILAFIAPFYFIHSGPETLLMLQTLILALGAFAVYRIAEHLVKNNLVALTFAFVYLMYPAMQRANIFEFHAVTFATSFILWGFYFFLKNRIKLFLLLMFLALLSKEQVGLTIGIFAAYLCYRVILNKKINFKVKKFFYFLSLATISILWSMFSVFVVIPFFRGGSHFATVYYDDVVNHFSNLIFRQDTLGYFVSILGPTGFLTIFAPEFLFIALPEIAINLFSKNLQLRSLDFQYVSVIQPWIFIGAIYGFRKIARIRIKNISYYLILLITVMSLLFSYLQSPLPYAVRKNIDPWLYSHQAESDFVVKWAKKLKSDKIKVSSTDQIAPFFVSRRYFYIFSGNYKLADYVIISKPNLLYTYRRDVTDPAYRDLKKDPRFEKVAEEYGIEVYQKI